MVVQGELVGIYTMRGYQKAPSTGTITLVGPKVQKGCYAVITGMSIINYTTANKQLLLGTRDSSNTDHYSHAVKETSTLGLQASDQTILRENESVIGVCLSPTANDEIYVTAYGLVYRMAE